MTRLIPLLLALPALSLSMVAPPSADELPSVASALASSGCEENPLQLVMYSGPRGWQVVGDRQQLDVVGGKIRHTQGRNETSPPLQDCQANPLAVQELLIRHLGMDGASHLFAAYDQAAWRQLGQEVPAEESVMRLVLSRDGLVLCSAEIPMGTPTSLAHAQAQQAARGLWQDLEGLRQTLQATQDWIFLKPTWNVDLSAWSLPDQGGCPGPITLTPIPQPSIQINFGPDPKLWPTLLED